ncbi:hypothetical protein LTR16_002977 [Cryomyces antarcticus]|uniref:Uncharacterized protein n=1 Tax=Cryomyces antarcticus TaxID=329879 RepID=A0ABR0LP96_9PEZI|nr:hypothetical protein LTR16_002977 [Cryomyces antarcticus]
MCQYALHTFLCAHYTLRIEHACEQAMYSATGIVFCRDYPYPSTSNNNDPSIKPVVQEHHLEACGFDHCRWVEGDAPYDGYSNEVVNQYLVDDDDEVWETVDDDDKGSEISSSTSMEDYRLPFRTRSFETHGLDDSEAWETLSSTSVKSDAVTFRTLDSKTQGIDGEGQPNARVASSSMMGSPFMQCSSTLTVADVVSNRSPIEVPRRMDDVASQNCQERDQILTLSLVRPIDVFAHHRPRSEGDDSPSNLRQRTHVPRSEASKKE